DRLTNFKVEVYKAHPHMSSSRAQTCSTKRGAMKMNERYLGTCSKLLRGRYVKVTQRTTPLTLCEVEVMAISGLF
ncbi:hypothetical protein BaRGS_00011174, partial [Batillaria attramentaria]